MYGVYFFGLILGLLSAAAQADVVQGSNGEYYKFTQSGKKVLIECRYGVESQVSTNIIRCKQGTFHGGPYLVDESGTLVRIDL